MEKHAHCTKCGQGFTREELDKHMKVFHEPLKCECGVVLEMEEMVSKHVPEHVEVYSFLLEFFLVVAN